MAKKNSSIRDLTSGLSALTEKEGGRDSAGGNLRSRRASSAPLNSPLNYLPPHPEDPLRTNILPFPLPVSGRMVEARLQQLDASQCFASPFNPREQSLLSMEDPLVAELARAIEREGQRDPVLARPVKTPEGLRFEVIYGTTRLFIAKAQNRFLKAWVADVPDGDARRLARAENKDRRDLSAWEKAVDLKRQIGGLYAGKSHEFIAEQEGISRPMITKMLRLADIDIALLRLLISPHTLSLKAGTQILTLLDSFDEEARAVALAACETQAPFADAADLLKALRTQKRASEAKALKLDARKPLVVKAGEKAVMRVAPHRTEAGQFKIDLYGFSQEELAELVAFVKRSRGLN
jgi:ParB/RepB/Spo0J family partition protein